MRSKRWVIGIAAGLALASPAPLALPAAADAAEEADISSCGHLPELAAAKGAIERGDKEAALRHLRKADELLARCREQLTNQDPESAHERA